MRALARKKPHLAARMKGPATAAQLAKVRTAFERSLPDPLLNLYRVCNGMAEGAFLGKWRLLTLAEMVEVAHSLRGRKLVNDLGSRGYRGLNWSPRFIPFGTDKAGDLLFTAPRMLGDHAFIKPLDPVYLYQHAEDQVVYRFAQLRGELPSCSARRAFREAEARRRYVLTGAGGSKPPMCRRQQLLQTTLSRFTG
jgi:cell wall assembly regulator SMI1